MLVPLDDLVLQLFDPMLWSLLADTMLEPGMVTSPRHRRGG